MKMMYKILKWLLMVLVVLVIAVGLFFFSMRFQDGPWEILSGGPFQSGEAAVAPDNWSFLEGRDTIDFQTLDPATSRKVWLLVHEGRLFIASAYMNTSYGKIWKQWPHYLDADKRIILRIDGQLYEQQLDRLITQPVAVQVVKKFNNKYSMGVDVTPATLTEGHVWLFEVKSRSN